MGGRLGPICRASTRAQDRCLLPSPGPTFHIGRPEGSSSSPQPHPSAGGSAAVPLCLASAILRGAVVHVVHAARGPASNNTVPARGVALRSDPGIAAAFRRAQPDVPPLPPSAVSTAPTRSPGERERKRSYERVGFVADLVTRRQALSQFGGGSPAPMGSQIGFYIYIMDPT